MIIYANDDYKSTVLTTTYHVKVHFINNLNSMLQVNP